MNIWKKEYDPNPIIASIKDSILKADADGVQFKAFLIEGNEIVLASMLDLPEAADNQITIVVREAIREAAKKNKVNKHGVEHEIKKSYFSYLEKPL